MRYFVNIISHQVNSNKTEDIMDYEEAPVEPRSVVSSVFLSKQSQTSLKWTKIIEKQDLISFTWRGEISSLISEQHKSSFNGAPCLFWFWIVIFTKGIWDDCELHAQWRYFNWKSMFQHFLVFYSNICIYLADNLKRLP